ncbi:capsule assembly Wzi family protein [Spirochaeta lutea]|uniref:Capsule assembly Wzi family protein n=1 Tax=Spirochaeta lutea TaxID=1480694 RepID=A0A098QTB0_9SPIO|nr:capsule assembly Wzi family protein [Spirochaeta lutea]KGE71110.1 hypothetical protein DC28_12730 [Spirochaeta lutea]
MARFRVLFLGGLFYVLGGLLLWGQQDMRLVPLDSPVYQLLDSLSRARAMTVPPLVRPYTYVQARDYLNKVTAKGSPVSEYARELIGALESLLEKPEQPAYPLRADFYLSPQLTGRTNTDIPALTDYGKRTSPVLLDMGAFVDGSLVSFAIDARFELKPDRWYVEDHAPASNIYGDLSFYDVQFPFLAYGAAGGKHWQLVLGRGDLTLGPGARSKLLVSRSPEYLDHLRFTLYWSQFTYTFAAIGFDPYISDSELAVWPAATSDNLGKNELVDSKTLFIHRFDFGIFDRATVGITEGLMWGGAYPDLRFLSPVMIMHNYYDWKPASSLFGLDLSIAPLPWVSLYGQFMFNQIQTAYEIEKYNATSIPNATGWVAGGTGLLPLGLVIGDVGAGDLELTVEYFHTDPYLYISENLLKTFAWRRRVLSNYKSGQVVQLPLGFVYGPDSNVWYARLDYRLPAWGSAGLSFEHRALGQNSLSTPYARGVEPAAKRTPTGIPEYGQVLGLELTAAPDVLPWLQVEAGFFGTWLQNAGHQEGLSEAGFEWSLGMQADVGGLVRWIIGMVK